MTKRKFSESFEPDVHTITIDNEEFQFSFDVIPNFSFKNNPSLYSCLIALDTLSYNKYDLGFNIIHFISNIETFNTIYKLTPDGLFMMVERFIKDRNLKIALTDSKKLDFINKYKILESLIYAYTTYNFNAKSMEKIEKSLLYLE